MFLLPVSFEIFENEPLGVYEMVLLLYNGYVYQSGNIVTVEYSDGWSFYISLSYDATSGLMQKMVLEDTYENDYARILYTHDKNAIPEGLDFIPLMSVIAILLVLPIFKRYKRYS